MTTVLVAAAGGDAALVFVELGAVAVVLSILARLASRLGITAIPLYLLAGLAVGEGGVAPLNVSSDFISVAADIGVLLLLLSLGLAYTGEELRVGLRSGLRPGLVDAIANFVPGFLAGLLLGWGTTVAVLLGGVTWISSSGIVSKVLTDLDRLGHRETPAVLNLLVIEDLAMAVYLPVVAALIADRTVGSTVVTVAVALAAVVVTLWSAMRWGHRLSDVLAPGNDEAVLLAVFGITLLVAGLSERLQVSAAIGAFLVGLALSGTVQARADALIQPLRDLFAATFFLFFSFQIQPQRLLATLGPALALAAVTAVGKLISGWYSAGRQGARTAGRIRAGTALIARGEFSIVIAALGASLPNGGELGALAAGYVLITAILGPLAAKYADGIAQSRLLPANR
ncbi:MAG: Putative transmembrane transport protein [uncultured Acidimicrobiales bacterium]|uniref:Transmembrane transport protein n=1 Tax=uncultured Acidimicrobiales bacterium TaxID=310071 RepID=A0A6J4HBK9_9ACTN|nr:MAG: Putative transmembrane transport protein [uncultured Acidimicrobiales bacterium]